MPRRFGQNPGGESKRRSEAQRPDRTKRGGVKDDGEKPAAKRVHTGSSAPDKPKPADAVKQIRPEPRHGKKSVIAEKISELGKERKQSVKAKERPKAEKPHDKISQAKPVASAEEDKTAFHAKRAEKKLIKESKPVKSVEKPSKNKVSAEIRNNFIKLGIMIAVGVGIIIGIYYGIQAILARQIGFTSVEKVEEAIPVSTQVPRERNAQEAAGNQDDKATPNPAVIRDISYGARDIEFKEKQINIPGIYDNELLFSAGTGSLYVGSDVLSKLYLYNLDAGDETLIAESDIYAGEYYETLVNHKWLVWLETDHGTKNYIMVMDRSTGKISKLQSFKEGQPKLNLYGNLLVWVEQVSDAEDRLSMIDLEVQEFLPIQTFTDKATYGVSSPYVYDDTIVWADRDPTQTEEDKQNGENSAIYYLELKTDEAGTFAEPQYYCPGTYVHEPLYNGDVFVWLDANKSPRSNLYIGRVGEEPKKIASDVTTYSIGEGIVVYGKDQAVWVYVIATEELCRITSPGEMGMLPKVTKRTVVWYNLSADSEKDVLRFKILTDEELYPGGLG